MTWKIVSDSSCDLRAASFHSGSVAFEPVPLHIQVGSRTFVDDGALSVPELLKAMGAEKSAASTSCPSPAAFARAFESADRVVCITISSQLSGTYHAACIGREMALEEHPEKKIFVLDSRAASATCALLVRRAQALMELYDQGKVVENIVFDITGNGGGNTAYWANNIVAPFGGTYEFREPRFIRDTPRTRWWYQNADLHPVEEYAAEYPLPDFVEEMGLDLYDWSVQHFRCGDSTLPQELLQAKRWLLVDDTVASASAVFTSFCLNTGWATVVGTPTGSYRPSGNPAMFALPNTGLIIRLDLCATPNREGQLGCIYGLNPDILCERNETPQEAWQRAVESGMV